VPYFTEQFIFWSSVLRVVWQMVTDVWKESASIFKVDGESMTSYDGYQRFEEPTASMHKLEVLAW
jgi:hypothetical protein